MAANKRKSPPSNDTQQRTDTRAAWGVCALLLVAVGLVYGQTLDYPLLNYDDAEFVSDNPHVKGGFSSDGIRWAFTEGPFGEWYPLSPLSHMLDCQLFGLKPWGHHLTNVLLHAAASMALFLVWWRMTSELWPSALVAALFAVHPQHVESVAWVAERKDVLSGLFFMLTLGAYLGYVRRPSRERYLLTAVLFALGLMAKPMLVTLPALLLLLDFWPLGRFAALSDSPEWTRSLARPGARRLVLEKLPLLAIAAADGLLTLETHAHAGVRWALSERLGNAAVSYVDYIIQFVYPVGLAAFYPFPPGGPAAWKVTGAIAILASVSVVAFVWRRQRPYLFVGWFWYLGVMAPVVGVLKIGMMSMADRYMYLPGIGLSIALVWGAARLGAGSPTGRRVLGVCAVAAIVAATIGAAWQTTFWSDEETVWRRALACTTNNGRAELALADELARAKRFDEAVPYYRQAQSRATEPSAFINMATMRVQQNMPDEAIAELQAALTLDPYSPRANRELGAIRARQGQLDEAEKHFRLAIQVDPANAQVHYDLALLLVRTRRVDEALREFTRAVELDPRSAMFRNHLASTMVQQGDARGALGQFEAALEIDPNYVHAHINLARTLTMVGQVEGAAAHYRRALDIEPTNTVARQEFDNLLRGGAQPAAR